MENNTAGHLVVSGKNVVSIADDGPRFVIRVFGEQWEVKTAKSALAITEGRWFRSNEDHSSIYDRTTNKFIRASDLYTMQGAL